MNAADFLDAPDAEAFLGDAGPTPPIVTGPPRRMLGRGTSPTSAPPPPPTSVLENLPPDPGAFNFRAASQVSRTIQDNLDRQGQYGVIGPIVGPKADVGSVARGVFSDLVAGSKNARAGMRQINADFTGDLDQAALARQERGQADLMTAVNTPQFDNDTQGGIYSGISSTVRQAPAIVAGLAALGLTKNPALAAEVGLTGMVAPMVPDKYGEYRQAGASPLVSGLGAAGQAGSEYLTEKLPMGVLVHKFGKVGFGHMLAELLAKEVPGEQIATVVQDALDTAIANPDQTWGDYLRARPGAAYQTLLATLTQSGLMAGGSSVVRQAGKVADAHALAGAINGDAQDMANRPPPLMVWQSQQPIVARPAAPPVVAPAAPALPYDPNVRPTPGVMVAGQDGTVRPMTADEFLSAEDTRQQGVDTGLTPDVRRAQEARAKPDVTDVQAKPQPENTDAVSRETPALDQAPAAAGPAPAVDARPDGADGSNRAGAGELDPALSDLPTHPGATPDAVGRDLEHLYQQDVKDSIRERLGIAPRAEEQLGRTGNTEFIRFLREHGVSSQAAQDIYGDNAFKANRALPGVFRQGGMPLDVLVHRAVERGFLSHADVESALDTGGVNKLTELIQRQIRGDAPTSIGMAGDQAAQQVSSRMSDELHQQARAIGFDTSGMDEAKVADALKRIERRRAQAQARKQQFDAREEARLEREAIQHESAFTPQQLDALDGDWLASDNVTLADAMAAIGFDPTEIHHATGQAESPEGTAAPARLATGETASAGPAHEGGQGHDAGLESYSPDEVVARQDRAAQAQRDEQHQQQQADQRAQADAQRDSFTLTGSNRPADEAAARGQDALFSKSEQPAPKPGDQHAPTPAPSTAASIRNELRERFGPVIDRLEKRGFLKLWDSVQDYNADSQHSLPPEASGAAQGMYVDGVAHLFGDGIQPGTAVAVLLHEVGEHKALRAMLGDARYTDLVRRAHQLVSEGDETAQTAMDRIPDDTADKFFDSELLAYTIEEATLAGNKASPGVRKWLADVVAAIRAWFYQTGFAKKLEQYGVKLDLSPKDIAALAERAVKWQAEQGGATAQGGAQLAVAHHGSPHDFERFTTDRIGTGEGNQAYGWGMYFAEAHGVGKSYADNVKDASAIQRINTELSALAKTMSDDQVPGSHRQYRTDAGRKAAERYDALMAERDAVRTAPGHLYQVDIPDPVVERMLLWDKPLNEQPEVFNKVDDAIRTGSRSNDAVISQWERDGADWTGEQAYRFIAGRVEYGDRGASELLDAAGIPGIKFLDGQSRNRRLKDIKREFLAQLPEDAEFDEVLQLAEDGTFSPTNAAIVKALAADDWLGFDYPAQAISAALSDRLSNFDASPALVQAVADAQAGATHNYVVFNDKNVKVTHKDGSPVTASEREEAMQFSKRPPVSPTGSNPASVNTAAQPWTVAEPGTWDNAVRQMQDNKVDLKRVRDAVEQQFGRIPDANEAYLQEELYHGKVAARVEKLHHEQVEPILRKIAVAGKDHGVTVNDVNSYLHALHAPERNAAMAAINPTLPNNTALSGMSDADAARTLADFQRAGKTPALAAIAKDVHQLLADTRTALVADGLEEASTVQAWEQAYKNYVPLMRDVEDRPAKGQGVSVRGPEAKRAVGSNKQAVNILANVVTQVETAAIRAEKAEVGRSLLRMAQAYPNTDFWKVDTPPVKPRIDPNTGLVQRNAVDPMYQTADNVVMVKDYGATRFIVFDKHNERAVQLAKAMKNLDIQQVPRVIQFFGKGTRFMASLLTQRNPEFWFTNFSRDLQGSMIQMSGTDAEGLQTKVLGNLPKAMAGMRAITRDTGAQTQWARYAQELHDAGGTTGYMQMFENSDQRMKDLQKEVDRMQQGKADPRRLARSMVQFIDDYNDVVENGMRLAVFQAARESGVSTDRAASIAKNITVNFNRKGNATPFVNSLYMFFNANLQGTARIAQALATSPKARIAVGTLATLAFIMDIVNRAIAGDDEETKRNRYDMIPEGEKARNWIFMAPGGKYVKVPLPIGFNIFHNAGRLISDAIFRKDPRDAAQYGWAFASTLLDAFSPIGQIGSIGQAIAPSVLRPAVQLAENKSAFGGPVYKAAEQGFGKVDAHPAYTRHFDATPDFWKAASKTLNDVTGGDKVKPGKVNIEPDILRFIYTTMTGGPGRALDKGVDSVQAKARGEDVTAARIPFANRFFGQNDDRQRDAAYYQDLKRAEQAKSQFDYFMKAGRRDLALEVLKDLGQGDLAKGRQVIAEYDRAKKDDRVINRRLRQLAEQQDDGKDTSEQTSALKDRKHTTHKRVLSTTGGNADE